MSIASIDTFGTGEFPDSALKPRWETRTERYPGFLFCYNRPLLAERVGDVLAAIASLNNLPDVSSIHLVGTGGAGPVVLLARALTPHDIVDQTIVDLDGASFQEVSEPQDPLLLPAALKYGGLGGLAALALPGPLSIYGMNPEHRDEFAPLQKLAGTDSPVAMTTDSLDREEMLSDLER